MPIARTLPLDNYVVDVLMQDLIGHDRSPAAFVVYLFLYAGAARDASADIQISHARLAESTGLSKSAVQTAVKHLVSRKLLKMTLATSTAVPAYAVLKPWTKRR